MSSTCRTSSSRRCCLRRSSTAIEPVYPPRAPTPALHRMRGREIADAPPLPRKRLTPRRRGRDAGDLDLDRAEMVAAGEIQRPPVVAAEGQVGRRRRAVHDAAELL